MNCKPQKICLDDFNRLYYQLKENGLKESFYGGSLSRHFEDGDFRLSKLKFDNSTASLKLWNFLLTEEDRLFKHKEENKKIIGVMKDLGTIPVMVYSFSNLVAFYPDGAWWTPCIMECSDGLLKTADSIGIGESFCPVRAMLGAFIEKNRFPIPDMLICSVGATCDDFSAIAQTLNHLGHEIIWWEIPHRRNPDIDETKVLLPGGFYAPEEQVNFVNNELVRIKISLENLSGEALTDEQILCGIKNANQIRKVLNELRNLVFTAEICPLPALEMQIAEMLSIHFCSDMPESLSVLTELLNEVKRRIKNNLGVLSEDAAKIFWINPVADIRVMNLLEECGGRLCGTDFMFYHALDDIPEDIHPLIALAQMALADPMVGSASDRSKRIISEINRYGAEGIIISRILGASHCATEGSIIHENIQQTMDIPIIEIEVSPISDAIYPSLHTKISALVESIKRKQ